MASTRSDTVLQGQLVRHGACVAWKEGVQGEGRVGSMEKVTGTGSTPQDYSTNWKGLEVSMTAVPITQPIHQTPPTLP